MLPPLVLYLVLVGLLPRHLGPAADWKDGTMVCEYDAHVASSAPTTVPSASQLPH
jgi:hypothetical protein